MMIAKVGLAAVASFIGIAGAAAQATPFNKAGIAPWQNDIVDVQYHGRRIAPPRKVCRSEIVRRWVAEAPAGGSRRIYEDFGARLVELKQALAEQPVQPTVEELETALTMMLRLAATEGPRR